MHRNEIEKLMEHVEKTRKNVDMILSICKAVLIMVCFFVVNHASYSAWYYWSCLLGLVLMLVEMILSAILD